MQVLLDKKVRGIQQMLLTDLQPDTKVFIALVAWTSPNNIAFLAITGYFINHNWKLQEALLGFEHISGCRTGRNMIRLVNDVFIKYNLKKHFFAITTDNTSNNKTFYQHVAGICNTFEQGYHVPCLAHVIQFAVKEFLTNITFYASKKNVIWVWNDDYISNIQKEQCFGRILAKVSI